MRRAEALRRHEAGQAALELAMCVPLVALLVAAIVETSGLAADHVRVWHAAREAARVASVEREEDAARAAAARSGLRGLRLDVAPEEHARVRGEPVTVDVRYHPSARVGLFRPFLQPITITASTTMRIERP